MFSLMTLQNSMDERKLKNYQAFHLSPCVCEVEWRGLSFQCDSEEG